MAELEIFDTQMEQYLADNHGRISAFYEEVACGIQAGHAFMSALSSPDKIRLNKAGMGNNLDGETEWDSPSILSVIEFLKESADRYPEDHPIWNIR